MVSAAEGFEWLPGGRELAQIGRALATLDLVMFTPLTSPDEIAVAIEKPKLRRRVDRRLKTMLGEDDLGLLAEGPRVAEVVGTPAHRLALASALVAGG